MERALPKQGRWTVLGGAIKACSWKATCAMQCQLILHVASSSCFPAQPEQAFQKRCTSWKRSRDDEVQVGWRGEVPHCRVVDRRGLVRRHHIVELAALWGSSCSGELSISGQQPSTDSMPAWQRNNAQAASTGCWPCWVCSSPRCPLQAAWPPATPSGGPSLQGGGGSDAARLQRRQRWSAAARRAAAPARALGAHIVCNAPPAAPMDRSARSTDGDLAARARGEPPPRLECAVPRPVGLQPWSRCPSATIAPIGAAGRGLGRHGRRPAGTPRHGPLKGAGHCMPGPET